jgi:hypothetical protein
MHQPRQPCPHRCAVAVLLCVFLLELQFTSQLAVLLLVQVAAVAELPPLALLPNWLVQNRVRQCCHGNGELCLSGAGPSRCAFLLLLGGLPVTEH